MVGLCIALTVQPHRFCCNYLDLPLPATQGKSESTSSSTKQYSHGRAMHCPLCSHTGSPGNYGPQTCSGEWSAHTGFDYICIFYSFSTHLGQRVWAHMELTSPGSGDIPLQLVGAPFEGAVSTLSFVHVPKTDSPMHTTTDSEQDSRRMGTT